MPSILHDLAIQPVLLAAGQNPSAGIHSAGIRPAGMLETILELSPEFSPGFLYGSILIASKIWAIFLSFFGPFGPIGPFGPYKIKYVTQYIAYNATIIMCKKGPNGPNGPKGPKKADQILFAMQMHRDGGTSVKSDDSTDWQFLVRDPSTAQ